MKKTRLTMLFISACLMICGCTNSGTDAGNTQDYDTAAVNPNARAERDYTMNGERDAVDEPIAIQWCQVTYVPGEVSTESGLYAYAQIFANGVSGLGGSHEGIIAQVGYYQQAAVENAEGEDALDYIYWIDAERNDDFDRTHAPAYDEYMVQGAPISAVWGPSRLIFRFSGDNGFNWVYCGNSGIMGLTAENLVTFGAPFSIEHKTEGDVSTGIANASKDAAHECSSDAECFDGMTCENEKCIVSLTACGDGYAEGSEECDGSDFGGRSCADFMGEGATGNLSCTAGCKIDLSDCEASKAVCGDDIAEGTEECDTLDFAGKTCADYLGQGATGTLHCSSTCTVDYSACVAPETSAVCGNGIVEGDEECDDGNQNDTDGCNHKCKNSKKTADTWYTPNAGVKTKCGDGRRESGELCEIGQKKTSNSNLQTALSGAVCVNNGNGRCVWQTETPVCGNGIVESGEQCDDGNTVRGDGCTNYCKKEKSSICKMRNGAKGKILLAVDGDTFKIRLDNGDCVPDTYGALTVRLHGVDAPECLKTKAVSPIDPGYTQANTCDPAKAAPCSPSNLYGYTSLGECKNHHEAGGYEAAEFVNNLIFSEENAGNVEIACETVSSTDATCRTDNTLSRYLAYVGVTHNNASVDLSYAIIAAGYAFPFTAFYSQRKSEYCNAEREAIQNKAGIWAAEGTFQEIVKNGMGSEKRSWVLSSSHCK